MRGKIKYLYKITVLIIFTTLVFPTFGITIGKTYAQGVVDNYFTCTEIAGDCVYSNVNTCKEGYTVDPSKCESTPVSLCENTKILCKKTEDEKTNVNNEDPENLRCNDGDGVNTAIGCVPINDMTSLMSFFLRWSIGIAGGIALLMLIYASFLYMTSAGDPKKTQAAQELMTATIAGLVFLILSVFILNVVGVDILGIGQLVG